MVVVHIAFDEYRLCISLASSVWVTISYSRWPPRSRTWYESVMQHANKRIGTGLKKIFITLLRKSASLKVINSRNLLKNTVNNVTKTCWNNETNRPIIPNTKIQNANFQFYFYSNQTKIHHFIYNRRSGQWIIKVIARKQWFLYSAKSWGSACTELIMPNRKENSL